MSVHGKQTNRTEWVSVVIVDISGIEITSSKIEIANVESVPVDRNHIGDSCISYIEGREQTRNNNHFMWSMYIVYNFNLGSSSIHWTGSWTREKRNGGGAKSGNRNVFIRILVLIAFAKKKLLISWLKSHRLWVVLIGLINSIQLVPK